LTSNIGGAAVVVSQITQLARALSALTGKAVAGPSGNALQLVGLLKQKWLPNAQLSFATPRSDFTLPVLLE